MDRGHYHKLVRGLRRVVDVHHRLVDIGDYVVIGHGISSGPEFPPNKSALRHMHPKERAYLWKSYSKEYKTVDRLFRKAKKLKKPVLFLSHNVPYNTKIDKIMNKDSPLDGHHMGSLIARKMIEQYQPLVCVGGHMHEHFTAIKIRKTVCINAGFGSYVNVWLELDGKRIKKVRFYQEKKKHGKTRTK